MATGKKTGGRVKGTPNKLTGQVKEMILEALDQKGGVKYLVQQADANPTAFLSLVGKLIPTDVKADISLKIGDRLARALGRIQ